MRQWRVSVRCGFNSRTGENAQRQRTFSCTGGSCDSQNKGNCNVKAQSYDGCRAVGDKRGGRKATFCKNDPDDLMIIGFY